MQVFSTRNAYVYMMLLAGVFLGPELLTEICQENLKSLKYICRTCIDVVVGVKLPGIID